MRADALLSRLEKVKHTSSGRWTACCPAHDDKSPSLSIREVDGGRVLVHCFAGCSVEDILGSVGLEFDALFPEKPIEHAKRERRPFNAADVLECVSNEARIAAVASANIQRGMNLSEVDRERLMTAASRLEAARRLANGGS
jgi:hypothetical protein